MLYQTQFMETDHAASKPGIIKSVLTSKCPHCRQGSLFINPNPYDLRSTMKMPEVCPVCGQQFELQTGFYFGTGFVSYGFSVLFSGLTFVLWWFTVGMSVHDNRLWWWLIANGVALVLLQPPLQRLSRSVWIACFVRYEPGWNNSGQLS